MITNKQMNEIIKLSKARFGKDYRNVSKLLKHLSSEVAELNNACYTYMLANASREEFELEIGDVIACAIILVDIFNFDVGDIMNKVVNKNKNKITLQKN